MSDTTKKILEQQLQRNITRLFKEFLVILGDIRQDHLRVLAEMSQQFPPEVLAHWNYLDLNQFSKIRKKVLDSGNDCIREILTTLSDFNVSIDDKKE